MSDKLPLALAEVFSPYLLECARTSYRQGNVLHILQSEGLVKARVKDKNHHIYFVHIDLKQWPKQPGQCGCPLRKNCEHVAACLLALKDPQSPRPLTSAPVREQQHIEVLRMEDVSWFSESTQETPQFFSYQLGIMVDGQPVNILPLVVDVIARWDLKTLSELSDNLALKLAITPEKVLTIQLGRLRPLIRVLMQYGLRQTHGQDMHLKPHQLLLLLEAEQALASSQARWLGTEALRLKLRQLVAVQTLPESPIPQGLQADLRDYQHQGLNWLQCLRAHQLGGVLADDMGLGKTVQTLAHLLSEKEGGRASAASLVLVPASLVKNWADEAKRFTPGLNILMYHGSRRRAEDFSQFDLVISTYGLLQRDKKYFLDYVFYYIILDEAQSIKNARAKTTQIAQQLRTEHRLCLSGTPLQNHLGELWSLFHFLMPGFLGDARQFRQYFRIPIEKHGDEEKKNLLIKRIQPFILRRNKKEVATELPAKTETILSIELAGAQRDLYEAIRMTLEKKVRDAIARQGLGKSHIILLDALLKLRQICCDPRLLSLPEAAMAHGVSAKLDALLELLDNAIEEGRSVLVFSQFTSMLKLIEEELNRRSYTYLKLTGQTQNRQDVVDAFQEGRAPVFLISLKAGGLGLNLTRADTVIHYDPWWNPAIEEQATDRSHRIGQINPVFVYKLIATGTVEETMLIMQDNKRQLVESILTSADLGKIKLTEEDIERFFMPLS